MERFNSITKLGKGRALTTARARKLWSWRWFIWDFGRPRTNELQ